MTEDQHQLITKKLKNYFDNENDSLPINNYDTFNKTNSKDKNKNPLNNASNTSKNDDINTLLFINEADPKDKSFDGIVQADHNEKIRKLVRFARDYCRASPNINFKEKYMVLSFGWRSIKSAFVVDYDYYSTYSEEKKNVRKIFIFKIFNFNIDTSYHDFNSNYKIPCQSRQRSQ